MMHLELNVNNQVCISLDNLILYLKDKQKKSRTQAEEYIWQEFIQDLAWYKHEAILQFHNNKMMHAQV